MLHRKKQTVLILFFFVFALAAGDASAAVKQGAASLLLPTTGQAMNGQLTNTKTKVMATVEVASITAISILGLATGGGAVLFGFVPLAVNHLWSGADAYRVAKKNQNAPQYQEIVEAQRTLDLSRQNRFQREQAYRSDLHERIQRAGEEV